MKGSAVLGGTGSVAFALAMFGCASLGGRPASRQSVCYPQQCFVAVQNDDVRKIAVRYYDSTGAGELLGSVESGNVRRFALSRRTSRTITVEVTIDRRVYRAKTRGLLPPSEDVVHFPAEFESTDSSTIGTGRGR
jgi:hypothetical protein